ncbi:hypothetical protein O181_024613 [Austropuccinia psidii MF-1]|uniref:Uncharacterized protein n=1 Tax=Austropuccinia psidii MF-1 TaxID=1389203 RepID=A0A9Q3GYD1_9BASI|nr:hypothetical protein [Austropuccinia psidii MF-1]
MSQGHQYSRTPVPSPIWCTPGELKEFNQITTREVWKIINMELHMKRIGHWWEFDLKCNIGSTVEKFKAGLVASVIANNWEWSAPTMSLMSLHLVLETACLNFWKLVPTSTVLWNKPYLLSHPHFLAASPRQGTLSKESSLWNNLSGILGCLEKLALGLLSDSGWGRDLEHSQSIFIIKLGNVPIHWGSKKQSMVALSTCGAIQLNSTSSSANKSADSTGHKFLKINLCDNQEEVQVSINNHLLKHIRYVEIAFFFCKKHHLQAQHQGHLGKENGNAGQHTNKTALSDNPLSSSTRPGNHRVTHWTPIITRDRKSVDINQIFRMKIDTCTTQITTINRHDSK